MSSNVPPPDLVRRAAERLGGVQQFAGEKLVRAGAADAQPERDHLRRDSVAPKIGGGIAGRGIVVSPTAIAARGIPLPSPDSGFNLTVEEFRSIRRHLTANFKRSSSGAVNGRTNRTILVTSACPGDGKTFTSINLALSFAFAKTHNVLLIDGDSRRRSLVDYLGITADIGWIDLLTRNDLSLSDVVLNTNIPNLSLLPSGKATGEVPDLVGGPQMVSLLHEISARAPDGVIIIDSLPVLVSNEPAMLSEQVGQIVFVVAADQTSQEDVQNALGHLAGCPIVSLLLNKGEQLLSERFSKYGYKYNYEKNNEQI